MGTTNRCACRQNGFGEIRREKLGDCRPWSDGVDGCSVEMNNGAKSTDEADKLVVG